MQGRLEEIFNFYHALVQSQSLFVYNISSFPNPPVPPAPSVSPPKPLAVIKPSIVTVTAEHASYACLFRVEELITTSQYGPYRQQNI